jgi:molecular chaperone GrpE (heat shock protein)
VNEVAQAIFAFIAGALGLAGSAALLRRRLSRDETEMTKDRVESKFVAQLLEDRDDAVQRAREASQGRQADREEIARLGAQNAHQAAEIARLTQEFAAFKRMLVRLYPETRQFLTSDFPPLIKEPRP